MEEEETRVLSGAQGSGSSHHLEWWGGKAVMVSLMWLELPGPQSHLTQPMRLRLGPRDGKSSLTEDVCVCVFSFPFFILCSQFLPFPLRPLPSQGKLHWLCKRRSVLVVPQPPALTALPPAPSSITRSEGLQPCALGS